MEKIKYDNNQTLMLCLYCFNETNASLIERICGPATPESLKVKPYTDGCGRKYSYSNYFLQMMGFQDRIFCGKCGKDYTGKRTVKKLKDAMKILLDEAPEVEEYNEVYSKWHSIREEQRNVNG